VLVAIGNRFASDNEVAERCLDAWVRLGLKTILMRDFDGKSETELKERLRDPAARLAAAELAAAEFSTRKGAKKFSELHDAARRIWKCYPRIKKLETMINRLRADFPGATSLLEIEERLRARPRA
jgi:hypothetical protein